MRESDEAEKSFFRTDRVFNVNTQWYFATREGKDHGPYPTRSAAEQGLRAFIRDKKREKLRAEGQDKPLADFSLVDLEVMDDPGDQRLPGRQFLGRGH